MRHGNMTAYDEKWMEENEDSFESWLERARREKILELINKHKPKDIIEVGPGNNPIFPHIKYKEFLGSFIVEPSEIFCDVIWNTCDNKKILDIENCCVEDVSISPFDRWDMIIISSVLHEIEDPRGFLDSVYDHCCKDTIVHINVPNAESFHRRLGKEMGLLESLYDHSDLGEKLMRQSEFNKTSLYKLLADCGFKILEMGTFLFKPFPSTIMNSIINERMYCGLMSIIDNNYELRNYGAELYFNVKVLL